MKYLKPLEIFYQSASRVKNLLYDYHLMSSVKLPIPVVSIGNLSFGGTGKTPCIIWLAEELSQHYRVAVVCRSYKTEATEPAKVDLNRADAAVVFGDEACLLQSQLPRCTVWSGPSKSETAIQAAASSMPGGKPQVILVDDGFSHRKLQRNFDLVLIDVTKGFGSYQREYAGELKRAHAVILTKTHLARPIQVEMLKKTIVAKAPHLKDLVFMASTQLNVGFAKDSPLFAFCGLAQPASFWTDLEKNGYKVLHKLAFADHQNYTVAEQKKLVAQFFDYKNTHKNIRMVTTAKDRIKLTESELLKHVDVVAHHFQTDAGTKEALIEKIRSVL